MSVLIEDSAQGVHVFGALSDESITPPEQSGTGLLLDGFGHDEAHLGLTSSDDNRLGIGCVIFLALDERSNVLRCDQLAIIYLTYQNQRDMVMTRDRPDLSTSELQRLSTALVLDRLAFVESRAVTRRERREKAVGTEKAKKFYARTVNEFGVGLDRFEADRL